MAKVSEERAKQIDATINYINEMCDDIGEERLTEEETEICKRCMRNEISWEKGRKLIEALPPEKRSVKVQKKENVKAEEDKEIEATITQAAAMSIIADGYTPTDKEDEISRKCMRGEMSWDEGIEEIMSLPIEEE